MNITREQYEADIRKAKAQALRDAADSYRSEWLGAKESATIKSVRLGFVVTLTSRANELDSQ